MNRIISKTLLLVLCYIAGYSSAATLNVAVLEYCPFVCDPEKEGGRIGFTREIQHIIFERAGHAVNYSLMSYIRAIKETETGRFDAIGFSNDRASKINVCNQESIGVMKAVFYVKKGNPWKYTGVGSFKNITVGVVKGYDYSADLPAFQSYIDSNSHDEEKIKYISGKNALRRIFHMITLARIDVTVEAEYSADYRLMKQGYTEQLQKANDSGIITPGRICFSPKLNNAQKYIDIIDNGIRDMEASGELKDIMSKYGIVI
jgi:polar amino acid transport system substrate-binding protein